MNQLKEFLQGFEPEAIEALIKTQLSIKGKAKGKGDFGKGDFSWGKGKGKWSSSSSSYRHQLDDKARYALDQIGKDAANEILWEMDQKGDIRNPSAYVTRACEKRGFDINAPLPIDDSAPKPISLDQRAKEYLSQVPPEEAEKILAEMESKGNAVRNHSAYIMKAVVNARKEGKIPMEAPPVEDVLQMDFGLDDKAKEALEDIGEESATAILQDLASRGDNVRNASAFVLKAVGNARRGKGAGGAAVALEKNAELEMKLAEMGVTIDDRAKEWLEDIHPKAAMRILENMGKHEVKNASAYIMSAIAKEKRVASSSAASQAKRFRRN